MQEMQHKQMDTCNKKGVKETHCFSAMLCKCLGCSSPADGAMELGSSAQLSQGARCRGPGDASLLRSILPATLTLHAQHEAAALGLTDNA